jgi:hypothetical protein
MTKKKTAAPKKTQALRNEYQRGFRAGQRREQHYRKNLIATMHNQMMTSRDLLKVAEQQIAAERLDKEAAMRECDDLQLEKKALQAALDKALTDNWHYTDEVMKAKDAEKQP